jgi:hypothetical protein
MRQWIPVAVMMGLLLGCTSPEAARTRGGGPGADVGNRPQGDVNLHAGSKIYYRTPIEEFGIGRMDQASSGDRAG